jgi:hypothetical protein
MLARAATEATPRVPLVAEPAAAAEHRAQEERVVEDVLMLVR